MRRALVILTILFLLAQVAGAQVQVRIKDIARIAGVRGNQLIGYGLVVGLAGTGDSQGALFTVQSVANMLARFGLIVPAEKLRVRNVAAVMATAELPPFARKGDRIDVLLSSLGDAKSLAGGTLLQTPLLGADGQVYAVAQGPVSVGGIGAEAEGTRVQVGHTTVGRVPGGATVEQEVPTVLAEESVLTIVLHEADFTTASRVASAINSRLGPGSARAVDGATVVVAIPPLYQNNVVGLISLIESLSVVPDTVAKVVVNERTGTVVVGSQVRILPVAIAHGTLKIEVTVTKEVSQPPPLSPGRTEVVPKGEVQVEQPPARLFILPGSNTVDDLVRALNALGVTPRDLIAILQALRAAGALQAELEII